MMRFFKESLFAVLFLSLHSLCFAQLTVEEYKLANGLTVILNPDKNVNDISGAVAVNTGSKNDPEDATGISHYLEHLLFKGTDELGTANYPAEKVHLDSINYYYDQLAKTKDDDEREKIQDIINKHSLAASKYAMPNEFDKLLKSIGSTGINATTNKDLTIYFNTFPSHQVIKWLNLYAHRFTNPVFRSFQSELEVVYEEKNRSMDNFQRRISDVLDQSFYQGHPYEKHTLGTVEHLKNPSLTKMYEYYEKYYVPGNMALILSGNFSIDEVKPIIEETFGKWESGTVEEEKIEAPKAFEGRKLVKTRLTPVKVGMYGFRTVPNFHEDEAALRVASYLLQNEAETGLIDELANENKVMMAFAFNDNLDEAGSQFFVIIPKIFGQSLSKVEKLLHQQLDKLKNGEFSDQLLLTVKNEIYKDNQLRIENSKGRGYLFAEAFRAGLSWEEMNNYLTKVEDVSREDVMKVAKQYFGKDYLVVHSRTGFPKKNKLKKPNFKPLKIDQSKQSVYAKKFEVLKELTPKNRYIDFDKDLTITPLGKESKLFTVNNPANNIYEMTLRFHFGEIKSDKVEPTSFAMNYAHPEGIKLSSFKESLGQLGTSMDINSSGHYFTIKLVGLEKNVTEVIKTVNRLIESPVIDESSLKTVKNAIRTDRKTSEADANVVGRAIAQYGLYGDKALLKNRMTAEEIIKLSSADYLSTFTKVKNQAVSIHYSGKKKANEVEQLVKQELKLNYEGESSVPSPFAFNERTENEVVIVNNKKLVQSRLLFIKNLGDYQYDSYPEMKLFNQYFGGGFSGILTQEVREYRSLAYSSFAVCDYSFAKQAQAYFYSFIGCQGDKTNAAADLAYDLIQNLPDKPERMDVVKKNVTLSLQSNYPSFRRLSFQVEQLLSVGYKLDPNEKYKDQFGQVSYEEMIQFYTDKIKNKPIFLGIYGDMKQFDLKLLEKIGKVRVLKRDELIKF